MSLAHASALVALLALSALAGVLLFRRRLPRSDRDWAADHAVPARVQLTPAEARIERLRDFRHRPGGGFQEAYLDETIPMGEVRKVWLVIAPFQPGLRGLAHIFLGFELAHGRVISVSVEARRRRGQPYSVIGGMFRRFEVTYVVGTESDLLGSRAAAGDELLLYPLRATPDQARSLFTDVLLGAEARRRFPAFYHSITHNCATVLREHVNRVLPRPLPFGLATILPGYADRAVLQLGLLDTELAIGPARERFRVDDRVRRALETGLAGADFSRWIRAGDASLPEPPATAHAGGGTAEPG